MRDIVFTSLSRTCLLADGHAIDDQLSDRTNVLTMEMILALLEPVRIPVSSPDFTKQF